MSVIALVVAAISGMFMAIQGSLNTALAKVAGLLEATFMVQIIGSITAGFLLLIGLGSGHFKQMFAAPWYTYLGGLLGVGIVFFVVMAIDRLGVAPATTAIIVGQVSTAVLIDHFGWFGLEAVPFTIWKGIGVVLLAVAAWLLLHQVK